MAEVKKLNEQELEGVNGGYGNYNNGWLTVCKLQSGYLAMRQNRPMTITMRSEAVNCTTVTRSRSQALM